MAELKNIDDYLAGDVDLSKVDYIVVKSGDANFFQVTGGAHFFGVDSTNNSIYKLWLDETGKLVSEDANGHKQVVAYTDGNKVQVIYGRHTDPYNGLTQPVSIDLEHGSDASKSLLNAFKGFAGTWFNNLYVPRVKDISVDVVVSTGNVEVPVESLSLDKTANEIKVGDSATAVVTIAPDNATNKSVAWESTDTSVLTVDNNGKYTGVKAGTANVSATSPNGKTALLTVTVTA